MDDRERNIEWTKPVGIPDEQPKTRKNVTQGCFYREIGCYKNAVPSEFQWFAEDRLVDKITYEELKCQLPDSPRSTFLMVFSPDGKKVASTHGNHNVYVTDLTTGKNIQTLSGHPRTPWCIAFHPSSNQILASGCLAGQVRVWDLHGGSEVWTAESQSVIASLAFHPIDRMLVIATYNELHFWDWSQSKPFAKCSTKSEREKVRYVSFDRLGNKLITGIANPVNIPSQWDRVSVINTQSIITTSATTSTTTSSSTTMTTSSNSNQGRSITFCDGYLMNQYSQLVRRYIDLSRSRRTPTIDRGTDPMDLVEIQNIRSQNEGARQCSAQCQNNSNRSSIRYRIMRSACRAYRPPSSRERFRIHSSLLSGLPSRSCSSSNSLVRMTTTTTTVTTTTATNQNSTSSPTITTSGSFPIPSHLSRMRPCSVSLVSGRPVCLTFTRENSANLFSMRPSLSATHSGAVTHPTYTSYSERSIFSTRETNSGELERSRIPVIRPYRIVFDDINHFRASLHTVIRPSSEDNVNRSVQELRINAVSPLDRRDRLRSHLLDVEEVENDRDLQRSIAYVSPFRRLSSDSESTSATPNNSQRPSPQQWVPHNANHYPVHPRPVPRFQMRSSLDLNNSNPSRRSREETESENSSNTTPSVEVSSLEVTTSQSVNPVQMNSGPVPRLQLRPRYFHDQQAQLRLITNTENHCSNSCQNLRRQFVLSRHSNSPFQPRVPHRIDHPRAVNCVAVTSHNISPSRPEIPSCMSSFVASGASSMTRSTPSVSIPVGNVASSTSKATNTATTTIAGDDSFVRRTREMRQRLYFFDQVKILLRDRIRNSSEHASTDSTVNYSSIANESEGEPRNNMENSLEDGSGSNGLGPRGLDPMLSSVSENADNTNDTPLFPSTSTHSEVNGESSSNIENDANAAQLEITEPWESDADTEQYPSTAPITSVEETGEQQESRRHATRSEREAEAGRSNSVNLTRHTIQTHIRGFIRSIDLNLSELSVREKIEILSQHIENMQKLCRARIEIIHLQQIKKMWEDLTSQIRSLHTTVHTSENSGQSTEDNEGPGSSRDPVNPSVSHLMRLAISDNSSASETSNTQEDQSTSFENSNDSAFYNNFKELVESMVNAIIDDVDDGNTNKNSNAKKNSDKSKPLTDSSQSRGENEVKTREVARNETEEPQPGPSGISGNPVSTRSSFRNRMYKSLRDLLVKRKRKDIDPSNSHTRPNRVGESECDKFQDSRHSRNRLDFSVTRLTPREFCCEIESLIQNLRQATNQQRTGAANLGASSSTSSSSNTAAIPSTSAETVTINPSVSTAEVKAQNEGSQGDSATICQSCGLKKKVSKDHPKQKRRSTEVLSESEPSGSSSKMMKTNAGSRSVVSTNDDTNAETASSEFTDNSNLSTSELLRKMISRMETMVQFQREVSRRTEELSGSRTRQSGSPSAACSSDESDSDNATADRPSSAYLKNLVKSYRVTRKDILSLSRTITQLRARRLLDYMVRCLTEFFEENTSNPQNVSDDQIISLYTLLHLALELTDLLLDQLNCTSRDLGRVWRRENTTNNSAERRETESLFSDRSRFIRRLRERSRGLTRSSFHSTFGPGREEIVTRRIYPNPFLRSFPRAGPSRLCPHSTRPSSGCTGNTATNTVFCRYRPSSTLVPGYRRCRRLPPRMSTSLPNNWSAEIPRWTLSKVPRQGLGNVILPSRIGGGIASNSQATCRLWDRGSNGQSELNSNRCSRSDSNNNVNNNNSNTNNNNNNNNSNNNINNSGSSIINNNNNNNNNNNINNSNNNINNCNNNNNINNSNNNNNINNINNVNNNVNGTGFDTSSASNNVNSNNNITVISGTTQSAGNLPPPPYSNLREQRPMFWIRYGGNNETSSSNAVSSSNEVSSREGNFTVPVVQVNDVPVPDVSVLNPPRYRPQSPTPRVPEDLWRWRAWRPRFLHPRYIGPHPFDDQDSNDMTDSIHYYRTGPNPGLYTLDPVIITDAPMSPHHRIQAWDFSKMNIPDISDREKNGVVAECKIHNDASVDVSNDGHLLVTLLPSGRLSVTTMLGVYSLDWNSLGQLLYKTSFEQNAVSVSLSPTNRHLLVGLASRPLVVRDRTNMAQIFRLEGARPTPPGGTWQSGRGRLILMRDLRQTRETNVMSLNCIRWAPGAGQGLVYGTNTGQLKVLR